MTKKVTQVTLLPNIIFSQIVQVGDEVLDIKDNNYYCIYYMIFPLTEEKTKLEEERKKKVEEGEECENTFVEDDNSEVEEHYE